MIHELKTWPIYFHDVVHNGKNFELRKNDREFRVGDTVRLKEYFPAGYGAYASNSIGYYTGAFAEFEITYILKNAAKFGLQEGYCILGLKPI